MGMKTSQLNLWYVLGLEAAVLNIDYRLENTKAENEGGW